MISIDFDRMKGYQSRVLIMIFIIERWFGPSVGLSMENKKKTKIFGISLWGNLRYISDDFLIFDYVNLHICM